MGFWDDIVENDIGFGMHTKTNIKTKNFEKYRAKIKKTRAYIKSQRETFYRNNNLKER